MKEAKKIVVLTYHLCCEYLWLLSMLKKLESSESFEVNLWLTLSSLSSELNSHKELRSKTVTQCIAFWMLV